MSSSSFSIASSAHHDFCCATFHDLQQAAEQTHEREPKVQMTGKKRTDKNYYWHTGYPGGIKSRSAEEILEGKFPERVLVQAVKRMLPGGVLSRQQMTNLKVYSGSVHPHEAQKPEALDVRILNKKNSRE